MTITLNREQEQASQDAIRAGKVASIEELIEHAIAGLSDSGTVSAAEPASVSEQGPGLFGSPDDAALLDEVVSIAYEERRRPSKREPGA